MEVLSNYSNCDFRLSNFSTKIFNEIKFHNSDLRRSSFYKCLIKICEFKNARLDKANFNETRLSKCLFFQFVPCLRVKPEQGHKKNLE